MNLAISGHHVSVSPALRDYVASKLDRIRRHFDQVIDVNVFLSVDKLDRQVIKYKDKRVGFEHDALKHQPVPT